MDIVIFSVGSPLVGDYQESLNRCNLKVELAIQNIPGKSWLLPGPTLITADQITPELFKLPFVVPLFTPANRQKAAMEAANLGFNQPLNLIDASVAFPLSAQLSHGLYINTGCAIGAGCEFNPYVCVNRAASIGHHSHLGAFSSVGPGAVIGGLVTLGKGTVIGAGAVVTPELIIGENAVIGAGAVVTNNVPAHCLVMGNPAQIIRENIAGYNNLAVQ